MKQQIKEVKGKQKETSEIPKNKKQKNSEKPIDKKKMIPYNKDFLTSGEIINYLMYKWFSVFFSLNLLWVASSSNKFEKATWTGWCGKTLKHLEIFAKYELKELKKKKYSLFVKILIFEIFIDFISAVFEYEKDNKEFMLKQFIKLIELIEDDPPTSSTISLTLQQLLSYKKNANPN